MLKINRSKEPVLKTDRDCFASKNKGILREALIKNTNSRCAYCAEENIATSGGEIDHFLPKNNFYSKKCEWTNLFWSCRKCNNHKSNKFFGTDEQGEAGNLLHKPLKFDDKNYTFEDNFGINTFTGEILDLNDNAKTTINMFNLNDDERNKIRFNEIKSFLDNKDKIAHAKYKTLIEYLFKNFNF